MERELPDWAKDFVDRLNNMSDNEFEALDYALSLKSDTLIIGSLHFVSSLRNYALSKMKK
jgi:hypothetical protein